MLRLTPDGRHLLTAAERRESALAATCIFGGVLFAASWGVSGDDAFGLAGASTTLLALLVVVATRMRGRRTRRVAWTVGALSVLTMLLGLGVALAVDGGRLPSPSYVPVAIAAPILATFGVPLLRRPTRPAFRLPWCGASRRPVALEAPSAPPTSRWITWPLMAIGLFAGMGLPGSLHGGAGLGELGLCAAAFGAAVALPALRPVLPRAWAASSARTLVLLGSLAVITGAAFAAAIATRHVPAEGAFVLGLYLLAASALVLNADSTVRRRRLAVWVASCPAGRLLARMHSPRRLLVRT